MVDQRWTVEHGPGRTLFLREGTVKFSWDGEVHLSAEHIAMLQSAYECGRADHGGATRKEVRRWIARLDDVLTDAGGLSDEMEDVLDD